MVTWEDCMSNASWFFDKESVLEWAHKENECICYDVGFLIVQNDREIILASRLGSNGHMGLVTRIPKKWVIKIAKKTIKQWKHL